MRLPDDTKKLTSQATDIVEICRTSVGQRATAYNSYRQWIENGRGAGGLALANMLYAHLDRLQSHLFSPSHLRFSIDFENFYPKLTHKQGEAVARLITREWERKSIDLVFGAGVRLGLDYGCGIGKLLVTRGDVPQCHARLVAPWQFGVYNEAVDSVEDQEACVETLFLNRHEVWRRVAHLPEADKLYKRILAHSNKGASVSTPPSFAHQVLSTAILDTSLANATRPIPGGIVQLSNDPSNVTLGPQIDAELFPMHELWVKDDERNDWLTIQIIEPDILVAPLLKRVNLFCPDTLPYTKIQPNHVAGYFWGRSEIVDLIMLQDLLTTHLDDVKRLMGQQFDKLLAFSGFTGLTDKVYGEFRAQGFLAMEQGAQVNDLTPKIPEFALPFIAQILQLMDRVAGFDNILSGRGEQGVRAGSHADSLQRMASPRLRDRALLVERQCAVMGDKTLSAFEAKDARAWFPNEKQDEVEAFLISQLPEDRRLVVDSHSSSPIYEENHQQIVAFLLKAGVIDGASALELLNVPNLDVLLQRLEEQQAAKAKFLQEHPELAMQKGGKKAA